MNDELNARLLSSLDQITAYLTRTGSDVDSLVREQAPLVAQEIVRWKLYSGLAWLGVGLVLVLVSALGLRFLMRKPKEWHDENYAITIPATFISIICGMIGVLNLTFNFGPTIKAATAPRVIVIDYLRSMR